MLDRRIFQYAQAAERMRIMIRRNGHVGGRLLWMNQEDDILRACYPDYRQAQKKLKRRTYNALRSRARTLGIQRRRHIWTGAEISLLRRLYPSATRSEICSRLPGVRWGHIKAIAGFYKIRRRKRPFKATPFPIIDAVRRRCYELGWTMTDLDAIARTKQYFGKANWNNNETFNKAYVHRAIEALGGTVTIKWNE